MMHTYAHPHPYTHPLARGYVPACPDGAPCLPACRYWAVKLATYSYYAVKSRHQFRTMHSPDGPRLRACGGPPRLLLLLGCSLASVTDALRVFTPNAFVIRRQVGQLGFATET
eukprot:2955050-Prymnesium_polylepis.1